MEEQKILIVPILRVLPDREQPRKYFDEEKISELARSIEQHGIIEPIIVQQEKWGYKIIAGERRWRAAKEAGMKDVPIIVKDLTKREASEIALLENIQREDLNPIEEAMAYKKYCEEFQVSQQELSVILSKSRSSIAHATRMLQLPAKVQDMIASGALSAGHGKVILSVEPDSLKEKMADIIVSGQLSVRESEKLARSLMRKKALTKKRALPDTNLEYVAERMTEAVGTKVSIKKERKGGKIIIEYYTNDDLEEIYDRLTTNLQ